MKKKLLTDSIANELEGASLFFAKPTAPLPVETNPGAATESPAPPQTPSEKTPPEIVKKAEPITEEQSIGETMTPRYHDTTVSRHHDTKQPKVHGVAIEIIRKAVKEFGKEAATHRFTDTEKKELADLIYTYKNRGIRTSENEVTRIAVNFITEDYKENGENSVLHKILEALNE